jgi:hypothetical protein
MGCCPKPINLPNSGGENLAERRAQRWLLFMQRQEDNENLQIVQESQEDDE